MIEENIKINPQPEEFDDSAELEPVTFVAEDGGEENFWHIMTFPYEGAKYAALVPEDQIEELAEKIMKDTALQAQFKKDPVKAVEKLLGVDLPDDVIDKVVKGVQAKVSVDKVSGAVDALKKLF